MTASASASVFTQGVMRLATGFGEDPNSAVWNIECWRRTDCTVLGEPLCLNVLDGVTGTRGPHDGGEYAPAADFADCRGIGFGDQGPFWMPALILHKLENGPSPS